MVMDNNSDTAGRDNEAYIKSYNARITAQINELNTKKETYMRVSSKASSISSELLSVSSNASSISSILENVVLGGKSFDDGNFETIGSNLANMASTFSSVVNVCTKKINEINSNISSLKSQYL